MRRVSRAGNMELPTKNPKVICKQVTDGAVLLSTSDEVYFGLNQVGAWIWDHLPPVSNTLDELCASLQRLHPDVSPDTIRTDVWELLEDLVHEGLAESRASPVEDR